MPQARRRVALHFPADLPGMTIRAAFADRRGEAARRVHLGLGRENALESFVPPQTNVLVVRGRWRTGTQQTRMGGKPPVWFSLYRWADPTIQAFAATFLCRCRHDGFSTWDRTASPKVTPLAAPTTKREGDLWAIEQTFPADPTFPNGFRYLHGAV